MILIYKNFSDFILFGNRTLINTQKRNEMNKFITENKLIFCIFDDVFYIKIDISLAFVFLIIKLKYFLQNLILY